MGNGFQRTEHEFSGQLEKSLCNETCGLKLLEDTLVPVSVSGLTGSVGLLNPVQKHEPLSVVTLIKAYVFSSSQGCKRNVSFLFGL